MITAAFRGEQHRPVVAGPGRGGRATPQRHSIADHRQACPQAKAGGRRQANGLAGYGLWETRICRSWPNELGLRTIRGQPTCRPAPASGTKSSNRPLLLHQAKNWACQATRSAIRSSRIKSEGTELISAHHHQNWASPCACELDNWAIPPNGIVVFRRRRWGRHQHQNAPEFPRRVELQPSHPNHHPPNHAFVS